MDLSGLGRSALKENKIAQNSPNSQNVLLELILTALETGHNTRETERNWHVLCWIFQLHALSDFLQYEHR